MGSERLPLSARINFTVEAAMAEFSQDEVTEPKPSRRRVWLVLAVGVLLATLTIFWSLTRNQIDPVYQGKRLSDHLYDGYQPFMFPPGKTPTPQVLAQLEAARMQKREGADAALRALGPRAIPLILAWISESPKSPRMQLQRLGAVNYPRWGWLLKSRWVGTRREQLAFQAASLISQHCEPLAPILCQQIINQQSQDALLLLNRMLPNVPQARRQKIVKDNWQVVEFALDKLLRDEGKPFVNSVLIDLSRFLTTEDREWLVNRLLPFRKRRGTDFTVRIIDGSGALRNLAYLEDDVLPRKLEAAHFFSRKPLRADLVVPALIENLATSDTKLREQVCLALGSFGTNALLALPALQRCAEGKSESVALEAVKAMAQIEMPRAVRAEIP